MSDFDHAQQCDFCKKGRVIMRKQQLAHCRAEVPLGLCKLCGSKNWNGDAEAIIEEVVRREYNKLPPPG